MECYTTGPTTPNNNATFYENNNYGDQQLSNEHHNQHYYGYPCQNYMEPLCPVSQQPANSAETILPDNSAELWAAQQSCFSLSNDSIHSSQTGKFFFNLFFSVSIPILSNHEIDSFFCHWNLKSYKEKLHVIFQPIFKSPNFVRWKVG